MARLANLVAALFLVAARGGPASGALDALPAALQAQLRRLQADVQAGAQGHFNATLALLPAPVQAHMRRLQDEGIPGVTVPAACLEKCPSAKQVADSMAKEMQKVAEQAESASEDMMSMVGDLMGKMFDLMCDNKDGFTCMAENPDVCGGGDQGESTMNPLSMGGALGCLCDECPEMMGGMKHLVNTFMETTSGGNGLDVDPSTEEGMDAMLKMVCPMVDGMMCAEESSACASVAETNPMLSGMMSGNGTAAIFKGMCEQKGYSTSSPGETKEQAGSSRLAAQLPVIALALFAAWLRA